MTHPTPPGVMALRIARAQSVIRGIKAASAATTTVDATPPRPGGDNTMTTRLTEGAFNYARQLQAAGFAVWVHKDEHQANWFLYERNGYWGSFTMYASWVPGPTHGMPIKPTKENGSSMFIEGPDLPDPLTVEYAELVARPQNWNSVVGTQKNHPFWGVEQSYYEQLEVDA